MTGHLRCPISPEVLQNSKCNVILWLKFGNVRWNVGKGCWELWRGSVQQQINHFPQQLLVSLPGTIVIHPF